MRLDYQLGNGSATCDSEALFRQILASEMKEPDPFVATGPAEAALTVRLERDAPGFRGTLQLIGLDGTILAQDTHVERSCPDAADRLIIELMLRVFVNSSSEPPASTPSPTEEAPPRSPDPLVKRIRDLEARLDAQEETNEEQEETIRALAKALAEERKRKMDLTFALSAGALLTANLTSNVGPGVWIGGDVRTGPISLGLEVRGVLPATVVVGPYDFDLSQVVVLLTPCGRYSVFFGCAVAGAGGEVHYDGTPLPGFTDTGQSAGPVLQIGGRVGAEYFFGETVFGARIWGEVLYSAPQTHFIYGLPEGGEVRWGRPDVSAFFGLGIVLKLESGSANQGSR